jgi:hypothetical protein
VAFFLPKILGSLRILSHDASFEESLLNPDSLDMVIGFYIITVESEQEAFEVAKRCPAFSCGEYVEIVPCGH